MNSQDRIAKDLDRLRELQEKQEKYSFPLYIDSSMRLSFTGCPQKFAYSYIEHLSSPDSSEHLILGKSFARGLEITRKAFYDQHISPEEAILKGKTAIIEAYGDHQPRWSWDSQNAKTLDRAIEALDFYFETWPLVTDFIVPYKENGKSAVEFSFAIPLPIMHPETDDPILYVGRFDMLGLYNKVLFGVDEKTTSSLGASWAKKWRMRSQFTGYIWAAKSYDYPVAGMIIRGVSFLKTKFGSAQAITYREDWKIDRWLRQLCLNIEDMIKYWKTKDWPLDLDATCDQYGGCPFLDLCDSQHPERWKSNFTKYYWNPLEEEK